MQVDSAAAKAGIVIVNEDNDGTVVRTVVIIVAVLKRMLKLSCAFAVDAPSTYVVSITVDPPTPT